jgi:acetyl esterase
VSLEQHTMKNGAGSFRIYRPHALQGDGLLLYIRGGGFVVGSLETHNILVAELAAKTGLVTVAPDFRMAPEHPFPAALEDCYLVLGFIHNNRAELGLGGGRVVVCGDSSGANMAVSLCMMTRDRAGPRINGQALISPVLDFTRWAQGGEDAPLLTGGEMEYYTSCYCETTEDVRHPYVSALASGNFNDLPPAFILSAELDSLVVDSHEYARRLSDHGTNVDLVVEEGLVHAAMRARGLSPNVAAAWDRFCAKAAELTRDGS